MAAKCARTKTTFGATLRMNGNASGRRRRSGGSKHQASFFLFVDSVAAVGRGRAAEVADLLLAWISLHCAAVSTYISTHSIDQPKLIKCDLAFDAEHSEIIAAAGPCAECKQVRNRRTVTIGRSGGGRVSPRVNQGLRHRMPPMLLSHISHVELFCEFR